MTSKNTLFLNAALVCGLLYPVMALAEGDDSGFCLKTCTEEYCGTSQENYQHCQDLCRGKYDGLIKSCKKSAQEAGFSDEKVNSEAKFRPCSLAIKEAPSEDESAHEEDGEEAHQEGETSAHSSEPDADEVTSDSDTVATEASEKTDDTPAQDGEEEAADQESPHEEEAEASSSDDDDKPTEGEEA